MEFTNFAVVNLIGLTETLAISLIMLNFVLPYFSIEKNRHFIAHFFGVAAPVITSFIGHKYITFGNFGFKDLINYAVSKFKSQ